MVVLDHPRTCHCVLRFFHDSNLSHQESLLKSRNFLVNKASMNIIITISWEIKRKEAAEVVESVFRTVSEWVACDKEFINIWRQDLTISWDTCF